MLTVEMSHHIHESKFPTQRSSRQDDTQRGGVGGGVAGLERCPRIPQNLSWPRGGCSKDVSSTMLAVVNSSVLFT